MTPFTIYDQTGLILRSGVCPDSVFEAQIDEPGESILAVEGDDRTQYVDTEAQVLVDRKPIDADVAIGEGEVMITGVPNPCYVRCLGRVLEVTDDRVFVEFDVAGTYTIELSAPPEYMDREVEVEVP